MPGNLISNLAPLEPCLLLQRLNVEDNQIVCVPGFFTGMIMLKSFLLANNRISGREVAGVLGNMPALTEVRDEGKSLHALSFCHGILITSHGIAFSSHIPSCRRLPPLMSPSHLACPLHHDP
jgi:hypothetical protein